MAREIESEVRENRNVQRRLNSYFREPAIEQTTQLTLPDIEIIVEPSATVSTRSLNDTLVFGPGGSEQAFGRGTFGNSRGSWSQQATTSDGELTEDGRATLAGAVAGLANGLAFAALGTDGTAASVTDTALGSVEDVVDAWGETADADTTTAVGVFGTDEIPDAVAEAGVYDQDQDLVARLTPSVDPAADEEVLLEVALDFATDTTGSVAVTNLGTISDAIATEAETVGLKEIALGTDGTDPTTSDTALGTEVVRKEGAQETGPERVSIYTVVSRGEPGTQPHDLRELGVFDDSGTMVWRWTFDAEFKDDRIRLRPSSGVAFV